MFFKGLAKNMQSGSESIAIYIRAKDGNRPHLMRSAFAEDATLEMVVNTGRSSFRCALTPSGDFAVGLSSQLLKGTTWQIH
jgi:hypothetical protein